MTIFQRRFLINRFLRLVLLPILFFMGHSPGLPNIEGPELPEGHDAFFEEWLRGDDLRIPELEDPFEPLPLWNIETTLKTGLGYRDNVLLSAFEPKDGFFLLGGFETSLLRLPGDGPQFSFFLEAEHLEFISNDDFPGDTFASAYSQISIPLPRDFTADLQLVAFYLDQMIDLATAELPLEPIRVRGHGITPGASLQKKWESSFFITTSASASRQEFRKPLHNYWEYGPKVAVGYAPGNSELVFSIQYLERDYDDRRAFSSEGASMPGTDLSFNILRPHIDLRHAWGGAVRWRSNTRFGYEFNRDNESDYFAYDRLRLSQRLGVRHKAWELQARIQYSFFDYKVQQTHQTDDTRHRHSWGSGMEARRNLWQSFDIFGRYDFEKIHSNEPESDYSVNTWITGLSWQF